VQKNYNMILQHMKSTYTDFIMQTLHEASKIAFHYFGKIGIIQTKENDNNQVLTQADIEIGKFIVGRIQKTFPEHNIIDEEAGIIDKKSEFTWVVDPIDGTSNFAAGDPAYGIMIGLLKEHVPIAGGVIVPSFKELAIAEKGRGAFVNEKQVRVTKESKLLSSLVAYAIDGHQENPEITEEECKILARIVLGIRNLRASGSVLNGIYVAKGIYGGYLNRTAKIWDAVAENIIIEEAGGVYTDFFGKPVDYSRPLTRAKQNFTWCAASPTLHKQLQNIIHAKIQET